MPPRARVSVVTVRGRSSGHRVTEPLRTRVRRPLTSSRTCTRSRLPMPTQAMARRLTTTYVSALKPGATRRDISDPAVPGLVLRVGKTGFKSWLLRFKWDGTATRICLGTFPSMGLAEARQVALRNREWLERGIDPRRAVDRSARRTPPERCSWADECQASARSETRRLGQLPEHACRNSNGLCTQTRSA